jgi:hypothetical protein
VRVVAVVWELNMIKDKAPRIKLLVSDRGLQKQRSQPQQINLALMPDKDCLCTLKTKHNRRTDRSCLFRKEFTEAKTTAL